MPNFNTFIKRLKGGSGSSSGGPTGDSAPDLGGGEHGSGKRKSRDKLAGQGRLVEVREIEVIDEPGTRPIKGKKIGSSRLIVGLFKRKSAHKLDSGAPPTPSQTMRSIASAAALTSKPSESTLTVKGRIPLRMSECSLATYRAMLPSKLSEISLTNYWGLSRYSSTVSFTSCTSTAAFKLHCKLCLCDIPTAEMFELQDCKCVFCKACMTQYVNIHIMEGNVLISCPDAQCERKGVLSCTEVESLLDKNSFDRYLRFKFSNEVDSDPSRTWCPSPGCETVCAVNIDSISPDKPKEVLCSKCSLSFCSRCRRAWHANKTCEEFAKIHAAQSLLEIGIAAAGNDSLVIKRCPVCRVPIERNEGCAQMMCRRCKHVFCWYCLASLDDDFLLRHYDKGPCKNKLGHSRASIIWHRTQVVGIFAGFTILLLVASPLLLLAAPCILCCKCSGCNRYCDEDSETSASLG